MEEKFVKIDGNNIRYLESGRSGKPLVLIHGLGASAERWEFVLPFFEKHFRVIVPDLIGFGLSDKPIADYTIEFFSKFLFSFLEKIQVTKPILIGSSLGGQITADFAANYNNMVERLILVSPSGIMKITTPALNAYVMAALYPDEESAKNAFEMMTGSSKSVDPKIIEGFVNRMNLPNAKMAFMSTLLGLKNAELISEKLQSILVKTMVIWGENDPVIPIEYAQSFVTGIRDCRFYRMDNCGHTPYVEAPEKFTRLILDFIKE
jgi:pimeloyl-ACP methyl ester carboxylesterase